MPYHHRRRKIYSNSLFFAPTMKRILGFSLLWWMALCLPFAKAQDRQFFRFTGTMELDPIDRDAELSPAAIITWQQATADFYVQALLSRTDLDPPLTDPEFTIALLFASRPGSDTDGTVLNLQYRATASFISESSSYDPGTLALPAFRNQQSVFGYVVGLRDSGHAIFENLSSLSLTVQGALPFNPPTAAPVLPTDAPTATPTSEPTRISPNPTTTPFTPAPTRSPTFSLTVAPEPVPVPVPTSTPVSTPTQAPVAPPPTNSPTSRPVSTPTQQPVPSPPGLVTKFTSTTLVLNTLPTTMEGEILDAWTMVTISYLTNYIQSLQAELLEEPIILEQIVQDVQTRRIWRALQGTIAENDSVSVSVEFVSRLELPARFDANSLVNGAFSTRGRRVAYRNWVRDELNTLRTDDEISQETVDFFASLNDVIYVDGTGESDDDNESENPNGPNPITKDNGNDDSSSAGGLIGGIVGGLLVLLVAAFFVYRSRGSNEGSGKETTSSAGEPGSEQVANRTEKLSPTSGALHKSETAAGGTGLTWEPAEQPSRLNQEILVDEGMDDVSTIGEPYMYGQPQAVQEDERTATTSVFQTETYNSLLGRERVLSHDQSFARSTAEETEFSAFTGASRYLNPNQNNVNRGSGLLGDLGVTANDDTSFEQRLFPMDKEEDQLTDEKSLDYSLPTALM